MESTSGLVEGGEENNALKGRSLSAKAVRSPCHGLLFFELLELSRLRNDEVSVETVRILLAYIVLLGSFDAFSGYL